MIIKKEKRVAEPVFKVAASTPPEDPEKPKDPDEALDIEANPLIEVYHTTRKILEGLHRDPSNPLSPRLFETVKLDNGQFERIVRGRINEEYAVAFPAAFIRFVNVRYLVQQQRIGEGRATMRIRYILNNLNVNDDDVETEGFARFQQINEAIQDAKSSEPALNERCNLTYFDMPLTTDDGLQAYWIDYEIWFRITSAYQYRNWVERYLVMPPFTNHSDAPEHDTEGHGDHKEPPFDDITWFEPSVEMWLPAPLPGVLK